MTGGVSFHHLRKILLQFEIDPVVFHSYVNHGFTLLSGEKIRSTVKEIACLLFMTGIRQMDGFNS
jgi:hypothetical protein